MSLSCRCLVAVLPHVALCALGFALRFALCEGHSFALPFQMDTPQLNPADLYDKRKMKDASRLRAYNKILEQIYHRIRVISKLPNAQCYLMYTVPPFILGLPKMDLEDCVVYLIYQLRHAKYEVRYSPPNLLYISWIHHEKSYLVEQSPIMMAMMESAEKTHHEMEQKEKEASRLLAGRKSNRKVRIQSPGEFQGMGSMGSMASMASMASMGFDGLHGAKKCRPANRHSYGIESPPCPRCRSSSALRLPLCPPTELLTVRDTSTKHGPRATICP